MTQSATTYRVRSGLAFCVSNGRAIFLDVERNRYFALAPLLDDIFQRYLADHRGQQVSRTELDRLIERGIVTSSDPRQQCFLAPPTSTRPIFSVRDTPVPTRDTCKSLIARCLFAQVAASLRLRRRSLSWLPNWLTHRRSSAAALQEDVTRWRLVVDVYPGSLLGSPRANQCLRNSIALLDVGFSQGLDAKLVLGVHTAPFSAHAWIQAGETVLNDHVETVRSFTPILVL